MPLILPTTGPTGALPAAPANVFQALQAQSAPGSATVAGTPPVWTGLLSGIDNIYWLLVPGATSYNVYRGLNGATPSIYATGITATGTSPYGATVGIFQDTAATLNVSGTAGAGPEYYIANFYQYQVTAVNAVGEGPRSPTQTCIYYANGVRDHMGGDFNTGCTTNYNQTSGPQDGAHTACAQCTITSAFGIWLPWSGNNSVEWNLPIGAYGYLQLDVYALQSGSTLQFACHRVGDVVIENRSGSQLFAQSTAYGTLTANTWVTLKIPVADILLDWTSGNPTLQRAFYKVNIQTNSGTPGEVFRFDNVMFVPGAIVLPPSFDFYISPNGDDNNPGTLASPWSITAINNNSATYTTKRVGLMPGLYQYGTQGGVQTTLFSLVQAAGSGTNTALTINGGTAVSPTYVASCDAFGQYLARSAHLSALSPSTGLPPTSGATLIGQGSLTGLPSYTDGYITIDGLVVSDCWEGAITFAPAQQAGSYPYTGTTTGLGFRCVNCEVYNVNGNANNNMGGIFLEYAVGAYIANNKIHDVLNTQAGGNIGNCNGIHTFNVHANIYEFNTIYNVAVGIHDKTQGGAGGQTGGGNVARYNLIEIAGTQQSTGFTGPGFGNSGEVWTIHHNIVYCPATGWLEDDSMTAADVLGSPVPGYGLTAYNNTIIYNTNGGPGAWFHGFNGPVTNYNNIVYCQTHTTNGLLAILGSPMAYAANYNLYGDASSNPNFGITPYASFSTYPTFSNLSGFSGTTAQEGNSVIGTPSFAGSMGVHTAANYQLQSGSPGIGLGRVGGVSAGAVVNAGAWDGVVTVIGSNF